MIIENEETVEDTWSNQKGIETIENKKNLENKNPEARKKFHGELREIVADPDKARTYLRRAAMIEGIERAAAIIWNSSHQ